MKRIFNTVKQKWPEYFLEILVIVIGIYGAFALDNWNEDRQNNKIRKQLENSLLTEFQSNLTQLNTAINYHQMAKESTAKLLFLIKNDTSLPEDSIRFLIADMGWIFTFDAQNNVMRSATSSGQIHLIKNETLKNLLFAWTDLAHDASEEEVRAKEIYDTRIVPYYHKYVMEAELFEYYFNQSDSIYFGSAYTSDYQQLLKERAFENLMAVRLLNINDVLNELIPIREKTIEIINILKTPEL